MQLFQYYYIMLRTTNRKLIEDTKHFVFHILLQPYCQETQPLDFRAESANSIHLDTLPNLYSTQPNNRTDMMTEFLGKTLINVL